MAGNEKRRGLKKNWKNKKAVSEVVGTVILVAIVISVAALVWVVVNNLIKGQTQSAGSCLGLFEKVTIDSRYTCYNSTTGELQFSIGIGDVDVEEVLIGVSAGGTGKSFKIKKDVTTINGVVLYPNRETSVALPERNSGQTYLLNLGTLGLSGVPQSIQLSPVVNGNQCEVSDSLSQIDNCAIIVP